MTLPALRGRTYEASRRISADLGREVLFFVGLAAAVILVLAPPIWSGERSFFAWPDAREQTFPWLQKLASAWAQGYLALWDANTFAGHSFAGEFQVGVFYPPNWLLLLLSAGSDGVSVGALETYVILHFLIGAIGMAALLRHWRLGYAASACGALAFALTGAVAERAAGQPNIFFGLCWIPWVLWLASLHLQTRRKSLAFLVGAAITLQVLAGHIQPAFHTALIVAAMTIAGHVRRQPNWRRAVAEVVRSGALMLSAIILAGLPQWMLSFQYLHRAYRWVGAEAPIGASARIPYSVYAYRFIIEPRDFASLIDPWRFLVDDANTLYVGSVSLGLTAWFLGSPRRRTVTAWQEHAPWLITIALVALAIMPGHYSFAAALLRVIPGVGAVRELGRYVILFQVAMCIITAFAVQALWLQPREARTHWRIRLVAAIACGVAVLGLWESSLLSGRAAWAIAAGLLVVIVHLGSGSGRAAAWCAVAAMLATAVLFADRVVPALGTNPSAAQAFAPLAILQPLEASYGSERLVIDGSAKLPENYADVHRLQTISGHAATMYRPYFEFLSRDWSVGGEIFDLLNVRYVLTRATLDLPVAASDAASGLRLYERPHAYPRVFLIEQFRADPDQRKPDFELLHYDDHVQRFRIRAPNPTRAVVSEIAYPGWCARVNGRHVRIDKAVLGGMVTPLRSIPVVAGENEIEFRYRPFYSKIFGCD